MKRRIPILVIFLLVLVPVGYAWLFPNALHAPSASTERSDVDFAKNTYTLLVSGDMSVEQNIDWANLKTGQTDLGADYRGITDQPSRHTFVTGYVRRYSQRFKSTGANVSMLTNWKLDHQDNNSATVSAETGPQGHLLLIISTSAGTRRLTGIDAGP